MFLFWQFPPDRLSTDAWEPSEVAAISNENITPLAQPKLLESAEKNLMY